MDLIQHIAIAALIAMITYLLYVNVFQSKDTIIHSPGVLPPVTLVAGDNLQGPSPMPLETPVKEQDDQVDAAKHISASLFNPHATGVLPQNQDVFEKQADFGSDVTNIKHFYKNNPEVFAKILGTNEVTNVAEWERQSKEMFQTAQQKSEGPIQAYNFEGNFSPL